MKKIYFSPAMEVVKIQVQQSILTASVGFGDPLSGDNAAAPEFESDTEIFGEDAITFFE